MPHTAVNPGAACVHKVYSPVTEITDDLADDEWKHSPQTGHEIKKEKSQLDSCAVAAKRATLA